MSITAVSHHSFQRFSDMNSLSTPPFASGKKNSRGGVVRASVAKQQTISASSSVVEVVSLESMAAAEGVKNGDSFVVVPLVENHITPLVNTDNSTSTRSTQQKRRRGCLHRDAADLQEKSAASATASATADVTTGTREKRHRKQVSRFDDVYAGNEEERLIQQAIKNSLKEKTRFKTEIPDAPVFYPTVEEFKNPLAYIKKIRAQGKDYGIIKIVPPKEWVPTCQISMDDPRKFPTSLQHIHTLQQGEGFDDGKQYTIAEYKEMADKFYQNWAEKHYGGVGDDANADGEEVTEKKKEERKMIPYEDLVRDYWDAVETGTRHPTVEYGNNQDTKQLYSGFVQRPFSERGSGVESSDSTDMFSEAYYERTGWNLNNLPTSDGSVLKYIDSDISGVNVPWLYIGMLFASFCWHNEDNYMYSISYNHMGAPKQWYGVSGDHAKQFEKVSKDFLLESFRESPDLLHHMTTQISPSLLRANGVPVYKALHEPRTFIVTFPASFHAGFSYGFNIAEAVNFAPCDWLPAGLEADERYRSFARSAVFSHQRLLFTLLNHKSSMDKDTLNELKKEILRTLEEELEYRKFIYKEGVKYIMNNIKLSANKFDIIDSAAIDYDEMRCCRVCKHVCVFSAVACECDNSKVACLRHYHVLCKCPANKKFMLEWAPTKELEQLQDALSATTPEYSGVVPPLVTAAAAGDVEAGTTAELTKTVLL